MGAHVRHGVPTPRPGQGRWGFRSADRRPGSPYELNSLTRTTLDQRSRTDRFSIPSGDHLRGFGVGDFGELVTCSACGKTEWSPLGTARDALAEQCPDSDDRDPLSVLTGVVQQRDPLLSEQAIGAAARRVFAAQPVASAGLGGRGPAQPAHRGRAQAPIPGVLRLIDCLHEAGAQAITRPACPRCDRVVLLVKRLGGQWACRACVAKARGAVACSGSASQRPARR